DPTTVHITANVKVGADTIIYPNTILEGATEVGENCIIGPNTNLNNCKIDDNSSVVQTTGVDSTVGKSTNVGPFAYLRPNSHIGNDVKIGDFVEIKNSTIDDGTKVAHLTYVGDAEVGKNVNFGCGTVIVNYDGNKKHRTIIEDNCFIGCNTNLVSPVVIKKGAYTAAGSTITDEVPADSLAIARSRQVVKIDWTKKR
ncbi:MAG: DapH/DapD/GlmU-related protein, partial [Oscillospiraceae bacterium]